MTETQAYFLDCAINGLFIGVWLGMISLAVDNLCDLFRGILKRSPRIGSDLTTNGD